MYCLNYLYNLPNTNYQDKIVLLSYLTEWNLHTSLNPRGSLKCFQVSKIFPVSLMGYFNL